MATTAALTQDLLTAIASLESDVEAASHEHVQPMPPLHVLSAANSTLFAPCYHADERLLTFAEPHLHDHFFAGFERGNDHVAITLPRRCTDMAR